MALTDWKVNKILDDANNLWYDYFDTKRYSVDITIQYHSIYKKYVVYIYGGKIPIERKFKTKSAALQFAKQYMRTH